MSGLGWMVLALALLLGVVMSGEWLLARPKNPRRNAAAERIVLLTMAGGFLGAPFWWRGDPDAFAWMLPPLAGRMLAAAGWAFAIAGLLALLRPGAAQFRLIGVMLATYLGPLSLAIFLLHLDRFDPKLPVTWGFFAIVVPLLAGAVWLIRSHPEPPPELAAPLAARWMAASFAIAAGIWGAALFVWPAGPAPSVWLWPSDALTSRLIASMFLTIAAASWTARGSSPLLVTVMAGVLVYGVGVCLAASANLAAGKPLPQAYMAFWAIGGAGAAAILLSLTRPVRADKPYG
ncbi:hypothetical protein [Hoeflea sp.]|uniref:hypothetical protein n=1 Tax=Hoeflea sp. TaxID=1940281 RepID=UPI0019CE312E|nr:hypothetical protein [Hoeflea sp.]MBC7285905.1 hypothetical protein [Hoeflea sp.]